MEYVPTLGKLFGIKYKKLKLIIFDIDGTLANTKKVDDRCFIEAFQSTFKYDLSNQDWSVLKNVTDWGITEEIIQLNFNRNPTEQEYETMLDTFADLLLKAKKSAPEKFQEVPGAKAFFERLKNDSNIVLGIGTGAWKKSAEIKLSSIGIDHSNVAFSNSDHYQSREDITLHVIEQARAQIKEEPKEIIYFGDGVWDYKTCKNLNIKFIGIDVLKDEKLKNLGAKIVFENFLDQAAILKTI